MNVYAQSLGLCVVDRDAVDAFNLVDEAITLSTVEPYTVVAPKQMVATVKIIPFAVSGDVVERLRRQGARGIAVSGRAVQAETRRADPDPPARPQG